MGRGGRAEGGGGAEGVRGVGGRAEGVGASGVGWRRRKAMGCVGGGVEGAVGD